MSKNPRSQTKTVFQPTLGSEFSGRFIKLPRVRDLTTLSTSEIYRRISAGKFPRQVMLGPKSAAWYEQEIIEWCEARIAERDADVEEEEHP